MSKLGLLNLIVPILLTAHGAQATYSDYVTDCANLLETLRANDSVHVPPHEGRPASAYEILSSKDLSRWLRRNGGQLYRIDGDSAGASHIFRWFPPSGESRVIKAYFNRQDALTSDRQFKFLDHNLPVGLLGIIQRTGKYRLLRFFNDVHGVTLAHLLKEHYYPEDMNAEIRRLYIEHLRVFKSRIIERYGENNVVELDTRWDSVVPDLRLEVRVSPGRKIAIWIHDENVLFDSATKEFWIIDPE